MAVEAAKVITALTAKLAGKNVSKKLIERYATRYAQKIDTDADIEDYIGDRFEDVIDAQSEGDRRATQSATAKEQELQARLKGEEPKKDDPAKPAAVPEGTPDYMKAFMEQMTAQLGTLTQTVGSLQQERSQQTLAERFRKDDRLKDVPEAWLKRAIPQKDEDFETSVTELAADYSAFAKEHKLSGFGTDAPAGKALGVPAKPGTVAPASKEDVDAVMKMMG